MKYKPSRRWKIMKKYLLVSGSAANIKALASMTDKAAGIETGSSLTSSEAGQLMEAGHYSAMIVNTPLADSQGLDLCVYVCEKLCYPVVLITSQVTADRIGREFGEKGIIVVVRPVDLASYRTILNCLSSVCALSSKLRKKAQTLEEELEERRLVSRAKAMLIKNMGMTEDQSHRFIEKQTMDLRRPRKEIAQNILKTYLNRS